MPEISHEPAAFKRSLADAVQTDDGSLIEAFLASLRPGDEARLVNELTRGQQMRMLEILGPEKSAELLLKIAGRGSVSLVEQMPVEQAAVIVEELPSRHQVDILR